MDALVPAIAAVVLVYFLIRTLLAPMRIASALERIADALERAHPKPPEGDAP